MQSVRSGADRKAGGGACAGGVEVVRRAAGQWITVVGTAHRERIRGVTRQTPDRTVSAAIEARM